MNTPKKQGKPIIYDPAFKIAVAREYLTSVLGRKKLAEKYNLRNGNTVRFFVRWYQEKYPNGVIEEKTSDDSELSLEMNKDLKDANLKIAALEMLIEEACKELGIDLVKKFGTKQPKK
ncbi:MAG: transposase [Bacteroidota bacterium]